MPEVNITNKNIENVEIIFLDGSIDAYNSELLSQKMEALFKNNQFKIIVDCTNLQFISSSGMGVFLSIEDDLLENSGGLKFISVSEKILNVFNRVGLSDIFNIYSTEAEALKDFAEGI